MSNLDGCLLIQFLSGEYEAKTLDTILLILNKRD